MIKKLLILLLFLGFSLGQESKTIEQNFIGNWNTPKYFDLDTQLNLILLENKNFFWIGEKKSYSGTWEVSENEDKTIGMRVGKIIFIFDDDNKGIESSDFLYIGKELLTSPYVIEKVKNIQKRTSEELINREILQLDTVFFFKK